MEGANIYTAGTFLYTSSGVSTNTYDWFFSDESKEPSCRTNISARKLVAEKEVYKREEGDAKNCDGEGSECEPVEKGLPNGEVG